MKLEVEARKETGNTTSIGSGMREDELYQKLLGHFRHICAAIQPYNENPHPQVIGFTSSVSGEGVTTVALGVAKCLASETMARVVLIECNLRRPGVHELLGISQEPGLSNLLTDKADLELVIRKTALEGMVIIPAGKLLESPFPMMRIQWLSSFLDSLKAQLDFIVLDLPPIVSDPVSSYLANLADAVFLIVRAGVVPADTVKEAVRKLDRIKLKGTVLNGAKTELPRWLDHLL